MSDFDFTDDPPAAADPSTHCLGCGKRLRNVLHCPQCRKRFCSEVCLNRHNKTHKAANAAAVSTATTIGCAVLVVALFACTSVSMLLAPPSSRKPSPRSGAPEPVGGEPAARTESAEESYQRLQREAIWGKPTAARRRP